MTAVEIPTAHHRIPMVRTRRLLHTALAVASLVLGCTDGGTGPGPRTPRSPFVASMVPATPGTSELVYVSLPSYSILSGSTATIHVQRTGARAVVDMVEGGFDPVAVTATVGDRVTVTIATLLGSAPVTFELIVPRITRPVIVRTNPPKQKRDVPLNASMLVVLSEPIDPASVGVDALQLRRGSTRVAGVVEFTDATRTSIRFTPNDLLSAGTDYEMIVASSLRDASGMTLDAGVTVPFTTAGIPQDSVPVLDTSPPPVPGYIHLSNADGTGKTALVAGNSPAWSPDGQKIAFDRDGRIRVISVDGQGEIELGPGYSPSWSPDGLQIAFSRDGIRVMNVDGSGERLLVAPGFRKDTYDPWDMGVAMPRWSPAGGPAGGRIAFVHLGEGDWEPQQIYIVDMDGSRPRTLSGTPLFRNAESDPSWSPDGSRVVFWSYWYGITTVDANDGSRRAIPAEMPGVAYSAQPAWSPDEKLLTYTRDQSVWIVATQGGTARLLVPRAFHASWSPVANRIAFVAY